MEYNKSVSNPMLMGAIELMKAENTPEHRKMVSEQILNAHFLSPAAVDPIPEPNDKGERIIGPEHHVRIPVLMSSGGKPFFMAFTDMTELKKWKDEEEQQTLSMSFADYAGMLFRKDGQGNPSPVVGFVINPFSENIIVPKEMVEHYMKAGLAQAKGIVPTDSQN